jgi:hypothetical protein
VLELTQGQRFPLQTADDLMTYLEQQHKKLNICDAALETNTAAGTDPAAAPAADGGSDANEGEVMEPPEQLLQMLHFTAGLPDADSSSSGNAGSNADSAAAAASEQASANAAATAAGRQRGYQQVLQQFGGVLKQVTNSPACGAAVWGLLGRWYALQDQHLSCQEARLKQVGVVGGGVLPTGLTLHPTMESAADQCLIHLCCEHVVSCRCMVVGVWVE